MILGEFAEILFRKAKQYHDSNEYKVGVAKLTGNTLDEGVIIELLSPLLTICEQELDDDSFFLLKKQLEQWVPFALESIHRNNHLNQAGDCKILNQDTADALIVNFINHACRPLDLGMRADDLCYRHEVQEVRDIIASLKDRKNEIREQLNIAENRLAFLMASAFVAVDSGTEVFVYGVSYETKTHAKNLYLSFSSGRDETKIRIKHNLGSSTFATYIRIGEEEDVEITDETDNKDVIYHIHSFAEKEEAEEWAKLRRLEISSTSPS